MPRKKTNICPKKGDCAVFISGLDQNISNPKLHEEFSKCGKISKITIKRLNNDRQNVGFCHVEFDDKEGYNNALRKHGMKLNGKYLEIMPAKGQKRLEKISKKLDSDKINNW